MRWIIALLLVGIGVWMYFVGAKPTGEENRFTIFNDEQYTNVFKAARNATQRAIYDFDSGKALSSIQIEGLQQSRLLFEKLIAYRPNDFVSHMFLAKTLRALGENDKARRSYEQALALIPSDTVDPSVIWLEAEIRYDLSRHYFSAADYTMAEQYCDESVRRIPGNAKFLAGAAQTKFVLKKFDESRKLVDRALVMTKKDSLANQLDGDLKAMGR